MPNMKYILKDFDSFDNGKSSLKEDNQDSLSPLKEMLQPNISTVTFSLQSYIFAFKLYQVVVVFYF